jgi:outer membrane protein, adhesin transport system
VLANRYGVRFFVGTPPPKLIAGEQFSQKGCSQSLKLHVMKSKLRAKNFGLLIRSVFSGGWVFVLAVQQSWAQSALGVEALVYKAISQHPSVLAGKAEERGLVEDLEAARLQRWPSLSMTSETSGGRLGSTIAAELPLWDAGRLEAKIQMADLSVAAQREAVRESQYGLALRVIDAWQALMQASERKRVHAEMREKIDYYQAMMSRRVRADISPRVDMDLIEARAVQSKIDFQAADLAQRIARDRLQYLVGEALPLDGLLQLPLEQQVARLQGMAREGWSGRFDEAVDVHPAVRKARRQADAAVQQLRLKEAAQWPQVYVRLQKSMGALDLPSNGKSLFLGFKYEPGAGFSSAALARGAQVRVEGAQALVDVARREVVDAIQADYKEVLNSRDRISSLGLATVASRLVVESYERQFVAGRRTWQEVLNALRERGDYAVALGDAQSQMLGGAWRLAVRVGELDWQQGGG